LKVRQDAYAKANPLIVEQQKPVNERGFYIHPELYGQPAEKQTEWGRHPQQMQRMKVQRQAQKNRSLEKPPTRPNPQFGPPASAVNRKFIPQTTPALKPVAAVKP